MEVPVRYIVYAVVIAAVGGSLIQKQWDGKELQKVQDKLTSSEKNHTVTVIKKITRPDGSTEEDTTKTEDQVKKDIEQHIAESSKPAYNPQWFIGASSTVNAGNNQIYALNLYRQLLGPVFVGGYANSNREVGLSVGVLF